MYDIVAEVRNKMSNYQAILYLLLKPDSSMKFNRDPQLLEAIANGDIDFVRNWFRSDLDSLTLNELRDLAQRSGVRPVYGKSKAQLIMEIGVVRTRRSDGAESENDRIRAGR